MTEVAFVDAYPHQLGGAQRTMLEIVANCQGISPTVVTLGEGPVAERARAAGVATVVLRPGRGARRFHGAALSSIGSSISAATGFVRTNVAMFTNLRRRRVEAVYCSNTRSVLATGLGARAAGVPVLWYVQNLALSFGMADRIAARLSTRIDCISARYDAVLTPPLVRRHRHKIGVIPLGVVDGVGSSVGASREPRRSDELPVRIAHVGAISIAKGVDAVIAAVGRLVAAGHQVSLRLIGDPDEPETERAFRRLADEVGATPVIEWMGYRGDVLELLPECDILVLASLVEGLPRVIAEAMAAGAAVVATDVGGVADLVQHERTGLLVPPGELDPFVAALERLVTDASLRTSLAEAARDHVHENFSRQNFYAAMSASLTAMARAR